MGLPRSSTTIDRDMRLGVPEDRISAYAHCLGITPAAMASPQTDIPELLGSPRVAVAEKSPTMAMNFRDYFPERYLEHNSDTYISELFALMNGVYRMRYLLHGVDTIHRCCVWVDRAESYRISAKGMFIMFGMENLAHGNYFRWHNNLHLHYVCQNGMELGYAMTVDPLRHNLVKRRNPFWLKGHGLTDRGLEGNIPISFLFKKEKLPVPMGMSLKDLWEMECEELRQKPFYAPGEEEYDVFWAEIMSPDSLSGEG